MGIPAHWVENKTNPKCSRCGSRNFSEIGECTICGEMLLFFGNNIVSTEKEKPIRRRIIAAEKWSKTGIPKNHIFRCIVCGCNPPKIEDIYKEGAISIMIALLLKEKPEWEKAKKIIEKVYSDCETREKEIQLVTKALVRETNMVLPLNNIETLQAEAEKFLGEGKYSICLQCLAANNENHEAELEENQESSLAAAMKKQESEEDNDMGPKFRPKLEHDPKWGEDTIDHEEYTDDPDELEEDPDWNEDDDWEDDWEETDQVEQAPVASPVPVLVSGASNEEDGFYDPFSENDADW